MLWAVQFEGSLATFLAEHTGGLADGAGLFGFHCIYILYYNRLLLSSCRSPHSGTFVRYSETNSEAHAAAGHDAILGVPRASSAHGVGVAVAEPEELPTGGVAPKC